MCVPIVCVLVCFAYRARYRVAVWIKPAYQCGCQNLATVVIARYRVDRCLRGTHALHSDMASLPTVYREAAVRFVTTDETVES